jgi:hypothetical protein
MVLERKDSGEAKQMEDKIHSLCETFGIVVSLFSLINS